MAKILNKLSLNLFSIASDSPKSHNKKSKKIDVENSYTHIQPPPAFSPRDFFLIGLEVVIYAVFHFTEPFFLRVLNFADRGHSAKSAKIWTKIVLLWGRNQCKVKRMKFIADELPSDIFHNRNLDEIVPISTLHTQFSEPKSLLIKM